MSPFDFGSLGFWVFLAAIIVGGMWKEYRLQAEKHETLRRIVEKTGTIDELKLKELFSEDSGENSKPGDGYRTARVFGTIVMFVGAGIATFVLVAASLGKSFGQMEMFIDLDGLFAMLGVSAGIAVLGLGIFLSSRFTKPPAGSRNEPPAR